jgi:hypothetical protein
VPSRLRAFAPSRLRAFVPSRLRAFAPSRLRAFALSRLRAFVPSCLRASKKSPYFQKYGPNNFFIQTMKTMLTAGTYRLEITTQYAVGFLLKEPKITIFDKTLTVS